MPYLEVSQGNQEELKTIEQVSTPDIVGLNIAEAEKILKDNGLIMEIENATEELDKENTIIKEQTPKAGIIINKENKVYIKY